MFLSGEQLLEAGIVADRVPDRIDFQARNGNRLARGNGKQPAENCDGVGRGPGASFDFGKAGQIGITKKRISLRRQ